MQIHNLQRHTSTKKPKRVGRGGKRGKTSGKGTKGQKARAGHRIRPEMRDAIKKIPKKRGHGKNRSRTVNDGVVARTPINLALLEKRFASGEIVNPTILLEKRIIRRVSGKMPQVKILSTGEITKKLTIEGCTVSASAKEKIEKAGGSISQ